MLLMYTVIILIYIYIHIYIDMGQMQDILRTYYIDDEDRLMKLRKAQAGLTETYMYVYMYTQMGYNIYIL